MDKTIGEKLKELRTAHNLTLKHVGKELHLDASTLSKYETGKRSINQDTLRILADYYNVNLSTLLNLKDDMEKDNKRTYTVKLPFIKGPTYKDILLFVIASIGVIIYSLTESDFALLLFVFFILTLLIQKAIGVIVKPRRAEKTFQLHDNEYLFFEHPNDIKTFKKDKGFDVMIYLWFMFIVFFIIGTYFTQTDDTATRTSHTVIFMINFFLYSTMIVFSLFKQTEKKVMPFDTTNTTLNTIKYRLYYLITTITSFYLFLAYPTYKPADTTTQLITYILIVFYFLMTHFFIYTKFIHYKQYRLYKDRQNGK